MNLGIGDLKIKNFILKYQLMLIFPIDINEVINTIKDFLLSTNFFIFVFIFIIIFILVRKFLKIIQWLLGFFVSLWFTLIVIYFLITSGLMNRIIALINQILENLGL